MEVEAAWSKRRELDLQMKRLQEKNRALEEKVDRTAEASRHGEEAGEGQKEQRGHAFGQERRRGRGHYPGRSSPSPGGSGMAASQSF